MARPKSNKVNPPSVDLTGNRYGYWKVLRFHGRRGSHPYWECICTYKNCGNTKPVYQHDLLRGASLSCSRMCVVQQSMDAEIGQIYQDCKILDIWKIKRKTGDKNYFEVTALCHCEKEFKVLLKSLKSGHTTSCGCLQYPITDPIENYFKDYQQSAKDNNRTFLIDLEFFKNKITKMPCRYCGKEPIWPEMTGIDRFDNSIGYESENCVPCCYTCNKIKNSQSNDAWYFWLQNLIYGPKNNIIANDRNNLAFASLYKQRKTNSINTRELNWEINEDMYYKHNKMNCFYCGIEPRTIHKYGKHRYIYNGVDRFNNNEGYIERNCVTACKDCNQGKSNKLAEDFISHIFLMQLNQINIECITTWNYNLLK